MTLLIGALTLGFILSLLALGVFISFRIFDFPDITADGSITLGAALAAALLVKGVNPVFASAVAFVGGFIAGAVTATLATKFKINRLLAGILVMPVCCGGVLVCLCCAEAADGITRTRMVAVADSSARVFILISLSSLLIG